LKGSLFIDPIHLATIGAGCRDHVPAKCFIFRLG
jgi:hypothetical protein